LNSHNKRWTGKRKENENNNKRKHYNGEWKKNVLIALKGTQGKDPTQIKTNKKKQSKKDRGSHKQKNLTYTHCGDMQWKHGKIFPNWDIGRLQICMTGTICFTNRNKRITGQT
jgi:hypothetical protein